MLQIKKLVSGKLATNTFIVVSSEYDKSVIIDPGDDGEYVKNFLLTNNIKVDKIILTHGHYDHVGSAFDISSSFNSDIYFNKDDNFLIDKYKIIMKSDGFLPFRVNFNLGELNKIDICGVSFKIAKAPGHTPGSVVIYSSKEKIAFVGDLLFEHGAVGRWDFSYASKIILTETVSHITKILNGYKAFPGHGENFIIKKYDFAYL